MDADIVSAIKKGPELILRSFIICNVNRGLSSLLLVKNSTVCKETGKNETDQAHD